MQRYNRKRLISRTCVICSMPFFPISPMQKCCEKKECRLTYRKEYQKKSRQLNPSMHESIRQRWVKNHPIKFKAGKLKGGLAISTGEKFPRTFFEDMITANLNRQCLYCGDTLYIDGKKSNMSLDHKTPISRGGNNSEANLQIVCSKCNLSKASLTDMEFKALLIFLENYPAMKGIILARMAMAGKAYGTYRLRRAAT